MANSNPITGYSGKAFGAALIGTAAGFGLGLLFAPRSGRETRAQIQSKANRVKDKAEERVDAVKQKGEEVLGKAKSVTEKTVDSAKDVGQRAKDKSNEVQQAARR